jgi:hypothetical protein
LDAALRCFIPNNSWDNANDDTASRIHPCGRVNKGRDFKINALNHLDSVAPVLLKANRIPLRSILAGRQVKPSIFKYRPVALVPPDFNVTQRPWFVSAAPDQNPERKAVWSDPYQCSLEWYHHYQYSRK